MGVSIVMAYKDRLDQLKRTLMSIQNQEVKPEQIIIVDDASDEPLEKEGINLDLDIKIISVSRQQKTWINPCIPYNIGIKQASEKTIILQNPECLHVGNIVKDALTRVDEHKYVAYSCYSVGEGWSGEYNFQNRPVLFDGDFGWYNHPIYRPVAYHFCSAIAKENLDKLGGFDERYANGIGYDDDEFLSRVRELGLDIQIPESPFVVHQWHYSGASWSGPSNRMLFEKTQKETGVRGWI